MTRSRHEAVVRPRCPALHDYIPSPFALILCCALPAGHEGTHTPRGWERISYDELLNLGLMK